MGARRFVSLFVASLCVVCTVLVFDGSAAFAAGLEMTNEGAAGVLQTEATLAVQVVPNGSVVTNCTFEYGTSVAYGTKEPCTQSPAEINTGGNVVFVRNQVYALSPLTTYHSRLTLSTEQEGTLHSGDGEFTTIAPVEPLISGELVSAVGVLSVALSAHVNPGGLSTRYFYEYGTSEAYGSSTPVVSVAAGSQPDSAAERIEGLMPATVYHSRLVAENEVGIARGPDVVFRTFSGASTLGLPDERGYELVTPVENYNGTVYAPDVYAPNVQFTSAYGEHGLTTTYPMEAAVGGGAVAYVAERTVGGENKEPAAYLARRSPTGGWTRTDIEPATPANASGTHYEAFSSDLSVGILQSNEPLAPGALGEEYVTLYSRSADGSLTPFYTQKPSHTFGYFHYPEFQTYPRSGKIEFAGASADFSHMLFEANDALTPFAEEAPPASTQNDLYDRVGGQLYLVNVLPDGVLAPGASFGSPAQGSQSSSPDFIHAISEDGSRVFWSTLEGEEQYGATIKALYMRENDSQPQSPLGENGECLVAVDACTVLIEEGARFLEASSDGSRVYYMKDGGLYGYEVESAKKTELVAASGRVLGVLGTSENGEYVYFAAEGVLAGANGEGRSPVENMANLYMRRYTKGTWSAPVFIAALSPTESFGRSIYGGVGGSSEINAWQSSVSDRAAGVASDGSSVVFMSEQSLTGYDNGSSEGRLSEVYVYDATTGRLECASCDPSGAAAPVRSIGAYLLLNSEALGGPYSSTFRPRFISEDGGRAFFNSAEPLVSQDTNGALDVYEWERDGSGSCRQVGGCVYLLSGGTNSEYSYMLDASGNGNEVFIISRAELVPEATGDEADKIYDVRVGAVQPPPAPACSGTGCQGLPGTPPVFATPSSVTFNGVGNFTSPVGQPVKARARGGSLTRAQKLRQALTACRRKRTKRERGTCVAKAHKRYGPKGKAKQSDRGSK